MSLDRRLVYTQQEHMRNLSEFFRQIHTFPIDYD